MSGLPHEPDYIARTIETVRNHRDADNCWPQWANIFADQIEAYETELASARAQLEQAQAWYRDHRGNGMYDEEMWGDPFAISPQLRSVLTAVPAARTPKEPRDE